MIPIVALVMLHYGLEQAANSPVQASARTFDSRNTDEDALLAFKASLSKQQGAVASWNATNDFCRWQGVSCSPKHNHRVTTLNLSSEGLAGTVAPSIGNLTFLHTLDLSMNNMHGEIPSAIGRLFRLRYLDLSNNSAQGEVNANLKNCTSLESIILDSNMLTGEIPAWLGGLSSLRTIHLKKNNIGGTIPPSLANLSALQEMWFTWNHLESVIPEDLGKLSGLKSLALGGNNLSGTIPKTFVNLSSIINLSVAGNELHGTLPSDIGSRLPKLQRLFLGMNHFTGSLPASLANATDMYSLDIFINNFTGIVTPEIGKLCPNRLIFDSNQFVATTPQDWEFVTFLANCTRLRILALQDNMLGGMLPNSITNLTAQLDELYVGFNEISGNIPFGISNLVGLNVLQFSNNQFSGVLPDSIGRLNSLHALGFENNLLTGFLPSSLGNLTQLLVLRAYYNMFEGSLPRSLGNLQEITEAYFSDNKFTGPFPKGIFNLSSLSKGLDLSDNYFLGPLPPEISGLTNLAYLDISRNNLSGPLPDALSNCQSMMGLWLGSNSFNGSMPVTISKMKGLMLLNLTKNTLSGAIPGEIGQMVGLEELYLSQNNLSGYIPESIENMTLFYQLDLSFNHLDGKVPSHGVFSNVTGFSFEGNLGLCGGISELHLPPCLPKSMEHKNRKLRLIKEVVVPVVGIVLFFTSVLISISLTKKRKGHSTTLAGFHFIDEKYPRISYAELVQGTNGFGTENLIGKERYGSVYKCSLLLKNIMTTVAVKVFDLQQPGSSRSFIAECEALNKIRHRNLISAITCCSSSDSNQNDFKALVLEFMLNGNLHNWLHPDVHASPQRHGLTLMQRLNVAVDIADAVDYLHGSCEPPIIHCDLKPSNILLDRDLVAHVGDFGLAKIFHDPASEQPINSKSMVGIRGTIGYVAPEYGDRGQVSLCGDVYSFGIVILELFTGMAPIHDEFRDGLTLQKHAENAFPRMLMEIVDPALVTIEEAYTGNVQGGINQIEDINQVMFCHKTCAIMQQAGTNREDVHEGCSR